MGSKESKFIAVPFSRGFAKRKASPLVSTSEAMAQAVKSFNLFLLDYLTNVALSKDGARGRSTNMGICRRAHDDTPSFFWLVLDTDVTVEELLYLDELLKECDMALVTSDAIPPLPLKGRTYVVGGRYFMLDIDKRAPVGSRSGSGANDKDKATDKDGNDPQREGMIRALLGDRSSLRHSELAVLFSVLGATMVLKTADPSTADTGRLTLVRKKGDTSTITVHELIHDHICGYARKDLLLKLFKPFYVKCDASLMRPASDAEPIDLTTDIPSLTAR